jgi:hypothetical protein
VPCLAYAWQTERGAGLRPLSACYLTWDTIGCLDGGRFPGLQVVLARSADLRTNSGLQYDNSEQQGDLVACAPMMKPWATAAQAMRSQVTGGHVHG